MRTNDQHSTAKRLHQLQLAAIVLFCAALVAFCLFYLLHNYEYLHNWYLLLGGCLYRQDNWDKTFFTPATKNAGNILAGLGIAASAILLLLLYRAKRSNPAARKAYTKHTATPWYVLVAALALAAGIISQHLSCPSYDEVFSAVNCAELHPMQALSYYMLPNNHLYFNAINGLLFSWVQDPVLSGRWISTMAYVGAMMAAFNCLRQWMGNSITAFIALLPVGFQLTTWGLAGQARGYEVQLCAGWITLAAINNYVKTGHSRALKIIALCSIAGFSMTSSYLLFYAAAVALLAVTAGKKQWLTILRYQAITIIGVFLLYLPALCFSGIPAFTANRYVAPVTDTLAQFLPSFADMGRFFINYCFSMIGGENNPVNFVLFGLPLVLLLSRHKKHKAVALVYLLTWLACIAITLKMRHVPFNRNVIVQFSISMACTVYAWFVIVGWVAKNRWLSGWLFALPIAALAIFLARANSGNIPYMLYYNPVNTIYTEHQKELDWIDKNATISCSDECFLSYYMFRRQHKNTVKCATGQEEYYIKRIDEPMPPGWQLIYEKWKNGSEDYEFYKRRIPALSTAANQ